MNKIIILFFVVLIITAAVVSGSVYFFNKIRNSQNREDKGVSSQSGYIKAIYQKKEGWVLDFDPANWLIGEEAKRAALADGQCQRLEECAPNDFYIQNKDSSISIFDINEDVEIRMQTLSHRPDGDFNWDERVSFEQFKSFFDQASPSLFKTTLYDLEVQNKVILKIKERYIP